jgi:hypothetical protein
LSSVIFDVVERQARVRRSACFSIMNNSWEAKFELPELPLLQQLILDRWASAEARSKLLVYRIAYYLGERVCQPFCIREQPLSHCIAQSLSIWSLHNCCETLQLTIVASYLS